SAGSWADLLDLLPAADQDSLPSLSRQTCLRTLAGTLSVPPPELPAPRRSTAFPRRRSTTARSAPLRCRHRSHRRRSPPGRLRPTNELHVFRRGENEDGHPDAQRQQKEGDVNPALGPGRHRRGPHGFGRVPSLIVLIEGRCVRPGSRHDHPHEPCSFLPGSRLAFKGAPHPGPADNVTRTQNSPFSQVEGAFVEDLIPEEAINYDEVLRRGGANCGDEDFALFKCPHCRRVYLLEYEVDTVYLDPTDLRKRQDVFSESLTCVSCGQLVPEDEPWIGEKARRAFRVSWSELVGSGWEWVIRPGAMP